jgi:hypothetical protein
MLEEDLFRAGLTPSTLFDIECGMREGIQDIVENVRVLCPRGVTRNELVMTWYFPASHGILCCLNCNNLRTINVTFASLQSTYCNYHHHQNN